MKAGIIAASTVLVAFGSAVSAHARGCNQLFTVKMGKRAGRAVYAGTRNVTRHDLRVLGYIERCQVHPRNQTKVRAFDHRQHQAWSERRYIAANPTPYSVLASWYDDAGSTACGFHATDGVANRTLPCGASVTFVYGRSRVVAVVDDRGPFVGGRSFDLNANTKAALGCADLCGQPDTSTPLMASKTG